MNDREFLKKIKKKLNFQYEIGNNPNCELLKEVFDETFILENYKRLNYKKNRTNKEKKYDYKVNPTNFSKKQNNIYLFTYEYFINNGILLELNTKFFELNIPKFKRIVNEAIIEINNNRKSLGEKKADFGFAFINDLSILRVLIGNFFK